MFINTLFASYLVVVLFRRALSLGKRMCCFKAVKILTSIWQAACGDLSGYHLAEQLCKGIHKTRISCLAQSGIKWRSVCGKQSPFARHGPWQRLGFKASSTLDFALGCAIHTQLGFTAKTGPTQAPAGQDRAPKL
jgi:hypothetical protein